MDWIDVKAVFSAEQACPGTGIRATVRCREKLQSATPSFQDDDESGIVRMPEVRTAESKAGSPR